MKALISKERAKKVRDEVIGSPEQDLGERMAAELVVQINTFNGMNVSRFDKEIETLLLRQKEKEVANLDVKPDYPRDCVKFNPSGASKSNLELWYKAKGFEPREERYPYHDRWTRNSTAVHGEVQRDLLYQEKYLSHPYFSVVRAEDGLPAWEDNIIKWKEFEHNGQRFILYGKMDGILRHNETGKEVGFEFKTKSNTLGQVGNYKLKAPTDQHKAQAVAYSLLFGLDEFIFLYESVAKPQWTAGAEAKTDIRSFYYKVNDEDRKALLDKFAEVCRCVAEDEQPEHEPEKCFFSPYKYLCGCDSN
ncbi:hypothetical protein [Rummeliibacillus stabekisii]|uniref:hypothetical protein n=1 Tax=Rummeliibacillus stabekisii TaxID=241244 RepID=UPI0037144436